MSRTHDLVFRMINSGEFTPDEALAEAHRMAEIAPNLYQDTIDMLIGWAWEKQDEAKRIEAAQVAAEVANHNLICRQIEWERRRPVFAAISTGEEPF